MSELQDLYQQVILDHNKHPRNFGPLAHPTHTAEGHNPLCGDEIYLSLKMEGETIKDISFEGSGCAISKASSSIMTSTVKGKSKDEVEALVEKFIRIVTTPMLQDQHLEGAGKLVVFAGVREFPTRVKCASLAWHTLRAALNHEGQAVTTEGKNDPYDNVS